MFLEKQDKCKDTCMGQGDGYRVQGNSRKWFGTSFLPTLCFVTAIEVQPEYGIQALFIFSLKKYQSLGNLYWRTLNFVYCKILHKVSEPPLSTENSTLRRLVGKYPEVKWPDLIIVYFLICVSVWENSMLFFIAATLFWIDQRQQC